MGPKASTLRKEEVSSLLWTLQARESSRAAREEAFVALRRHFCPETSAAKRLEAAAAVDAERYPLWPCSPPPAKEGTRLLSAVELADRVRGVVFGLALGDATGLATEFLSRKQVLETYGPEAGIFCPKPSKTHPDTHRIMWEPGDWTDDTDQAVLVIQTLLESEGRCDARRFARKLVAWREQGFPALGDSSAAGLGRHTKSVVDATGYVQAPFETAQLIDRQARGRGASNGALMRTAPTGIAFFWDDDRVVETTTQFCRATHADPRCRASCLVAALVVARLLRGEDDVDAVVAAALQTAADECWPDSRDPAAIDELARAAEPPSLAVSPKDSVDRLNLDDPTTLGYVYKCLSAGIWALAQTRPAKDSLAGAETAPKNSSANVFVDAIQLLVQQGGDADTNAALAGALMGARLGFSKLPSDWIAQLPNRAWLEAHVQKLLFMLKLR